MRLFIFSLFVTVCVSFTGCGLVDASKEMTDTTLGLFEPNPRDYDDAAPMVAENWSEYGKDARSDRPTDKLDDPINKMLYSDKARAIERSVGYEYK
ncbi:hypothetical protein CA54_06880 [Symmachiella macrocystis]|uniref:Uncharacterized protein n=1 Tax=Symmachiella macrocystis TaxID=2527985 RepID=A0A5C6BKL4_9PLAN|nr:hypothetical protein [Symmachiella macrocystis]TWU11876.1 hypothetical protein CA54_06880 [Symmachiella macrocystis]